MLHSIEYIPSADFYNQFFVFTKKYGTKTVFTVITSFTLLITICIELPNIVCEHVLADKSGLHC
jgi:hypothetical protein